MMNHEYLAEDVDVINGFAEKNGGKLDVFSAREPQDRQGESSKYGFEHPKYYKVIEKHFYSLSSKQKIARAFE